MTSMSENTRDDTQSSPVEKDTQHFVRRSSRRMTRPDLLLLSNDKDESANKNTAHDTPSSIKKEKREKKEELNSNRKFSSPESSTVSDDDDELDLESKLKILISGPISSFSEFNKSKPSSCVIKENPKNSKSRRELKKAVRNESSSGNSNTGSKRSKSMDHTNTESRKRRSRSKDTKSSDKLVRGRDADFRSKDKDSRIDKNDGTFVEAVSKDRRSRSSDSAQHKRIVKNKSKREEGRADNDEMKENNLNQRMSDELVGDVASSPSCFSSIKKVSSIVKKDKRHGKKSVLEKKKRKKIHEPNYHEADSVREKKQKKERSSRVSIGGPSTKSEKKSISVIKKNVDSRDPSVDNVRFAEQNEAKSPKSKIEKEETIAENSEKLDVADVKNANSSSLSTHKLEKKIVCSVSKIPVTVDPTDESKPADVSISSSKNLESGVISKIHEVSDSSSDRRIDKVEFLEDKRIISGPNSRGSLDLVDLDSTKKNSNVATSDDMPCDDSVHHQSEINELIDQNSDPFVIPSKKVRSARIDAKRFQPKKLRDRRESNSVTPVKAKRSASVEKSLSESKNKVRDDPSSNASRKTTPRRKNETLSPISPCVSDTIPNGKPATEIVKRALHRRNIHPKENISMETAMRRLAYQEGSFLSSIEIATNRKKSRDFCVEMDNGDKVLEEMGSIPVLKSELRDKIRSYEWYGLNKDASWDQLRIIEFKMKPPMSFENESQCRWYQKSLYHKTFRPFKLLTPTYVYLEGVTLKEQERSTLRINDQQRMTDFSKELAEEMMVDNVVPKCEIGIKAWKNLNSEPNTRAYVFLKYPSKALADAAVKKFDGTTCPHGTYKAILRHERFPVQLAPCYDFHDPKVSDSSGNHSGGRGRGRRGNFGARGDRRTPHGDERGYSENKEWRDNGDRYNGRPPGSYGHYRGFQHGPPSFHDDRRDLNGEKHHRGEFHRNDSKQYYQGHRNSKNADRRSNAQNHKDYVY